MSVWAGWSIQTKIREQEEELISRWIKQYGAPPPMEERQRLRSQMLRQAGVIVDETTLREEPRNLERSRGHGLEPTPIRSPRDAERAARDAIRAWGWSDAEMTAEGPDGGVDIESSEVVAQVKAQTNPVSNAPVQQLFGVAAVAKKMALFFSLSGFTGPALAWGSDAGVAMFQFDLQGIPVACNQLALDIAERRALQ